MPVGSTEPCDPHAFPIHSSCPTPNHCDEPQLLPDNFPNLQTLEKEAGSHAGLCARILRVRATSKPPPLSLSS